jgi:hypothetical protein
MLPSLQVAVWSKPPLFTTQSSHFTKTTPRFPFADLCIPAAQSPFIQHSGTRGEGRPQTSGRYKVGDNAPSKAQSKPRKPLSARAPGLADWGPRCRDRTSKVSVQSPLRRQNTARTCGACLSFSQFPSHFTKKPSLAAETICRAYSQEHNSRSRQPEPES